jgi:Glycosyl hydrolases family 16
MAGLLAALAGLGEHGKLLDARLRDRLDGRPGHGAERVLRHRPSRLGASVPGHLQNGNNWQPAAFALAGQWHTYATLWTASQVCWYIDDVQTHCAPTYADTANSPMFLLLQMWIGGWTSGTNSSTPDELRTEIDWVSVWQR